MPSIPKNVLEQIQSMDEDELTITDDRPTPGYHAVKVSQVDTDEQGRLTVELAVLSTGENRNKIARLFYSAPQYWRYAFDQVLKPCGLFDSRKKTPTGWRFNPLQIVRDLHSLDGSPLVVKITNKENSDFQNIKTVRRFDTQKEAKEFVANVGRKVSVS